MKELSQVKKKISEHFDSLINQVDIHTEEQLQKFSDTDVIEIPATTTTTETMTKVNVNHQDVLSSTLKSKFTYKCEPTIRVVPGETLVCDYLNDVRYELVRHLNEAQAQAFQLLEMVKNEPNVKDDDGDNMSASVKNMLRKVFSKRFLFMIQINEFIERK